MMLNRGVRFVLMLSLLVMFASAGYAQTQPRLDYTVGITDAAKHLYHIRIDVSNVTGRTVDLSLPAWTPGWYTIRPYATNVIRLHARAGGEKLAMRAIGTQTYRVETAGNRSFALEYDYFADNRNVNGTNLSENGGFFFGICVLFYVPGHSHDTPARIKFEIPDGWRVATGLKRTAEKNVFEAENFDVLVDSPTVLGDFDELTTSALGKPIHIVVDPKGQVSAESGDKLKDYVSRIIESQGRMFGGLPYDEYWVLYVTGNLRGGGALEHLNSTNIMLQAMPADPRNVAGVTSHEHFHVWNVKRIRPAGIYKYDYSREQNIRELWFAEGFTSYYGDLHVRRAGLMTPEDYLRRLESKIRNLQNSEARSWVSLSDASMTTWLTYGGGRPGFGSFTTNYYNKGELVGLLMDLEIRGATGNRQSLDDLMRHLFENFYKRGRGYAVEDIEKIATEISGRSFGDFFTRYINGTHELDYNAALKHAGLALDNGKVINVENLTEAQKALRKSWLGE